MNIIEFGEKDICMDNSCQNTQLQPPYIIHYGDNETAGFPGPLIPPLVHSSMVQQNHSKTLPRVSNRGLINSKAGNGNAKHMHKIIERQRRIDMKTRFSVLRSLLPEEYILGKRSLSDQAEGAAEYIKHLQEHINELAKRREDLGNSPICNYNEKNCKVLPSIGESQSFPSVKIMAIGSGIEITTSSLKCQVVLSDILLALENEGLEVVSTIACTTEDKIFHTLYTKASDLQRFDMTNLHQKLCRLLKEITDA
ncbi:transcription factor bHLH118 [Cryptomeria japonica]|uniref:transcription factor bHLH118 n=1 Tax=Cryptomeria japonica TaxID=3369 RepID=UPI0025ACC2FB|nr:transcription factor bHLH118 [Cryptomeria japonica]